MRDLIEVRPPDYDKTFTYSLKRNGHTVFDDRNNLTDGARYELTNLVEKLNGEMLRDRSAVNEHEALCLVADLARKFVFAYTVDVAKKTLASLDDVTNSRLKLEQALATLNTLRK